MNDSVYLSPFLVVPLLSRGYRHVGHSAGKLSVSSFLYRRQRKR